MLFNLVSDLTETSKVEELYSYNQVIAYNLNKAFSEAKHQVNLVHHSFDEIPKADVTIVISRVGFLRAMKSKEYLNKLNTVSKRKVCLWLDSDFGDWRGIFERVFVANLRYKKQLHRFRFVGWAADPDLFRSEQKSLCALFDPFMYGYYNGKFDKLYEMLERVKAKIDNSLQPLKRYNQGRIKWLELAALFRKASHYVLTQPNFWGWTNIEAATCGALLVVHKSLDKPKTWPTRLCHVIYETEEELLNVLESAVDYQKNRSVALKNKWSNIILRILENLD